jgi:hypothetical protein
MNFIEAKKILINKLRDLKIKCRCGSIIKHDKIKYERFYCCICRLHIIEFQESGVYMNIIKDNDSFWCGFSLKDYGLSNDSDIILDLYDFINVAKLADFNKYIEKYNNLILFK